MIWGVLRLLLALLLAYFALALVGLIPVNNEFEPTPDGVEIVLISTAIHADIILPIETETVDWRTVFPPEHFSANVSKATHVAIGWGDQGFYIHTPTWNDLEASTAANAMFWPSDSCVHVAAIAPQSFPTDAQKVRISAEEYSHLVSFIKSSLALSAEGKAVPLPGGYTSHDAFFESTGSYHCLNTCNCWTGRAMQSAGIRTGWFTPMPKSMFLYLPEDSEN